MSNDNNPDRPSRNDPGLTVGGEPFDDVADRAGRELRRPAPGDGLDRVHRSQRRRRAATATAGGAAAVLLVGGGFWLGTRGDDTTISDAPPIATTDTTGDTTVGSTAVTPSSVTGQAPTTDEPSSNTTEPATDPTDPVVEETDPPVVSAPAVSDEVLPDPLAFAADGFRRELVGRDLVVRSTPEQVIPLDLPDPQIYLYGVGPNGVAYLRARRRRSHPDRRRTDHGAELRAPCTNSSPRTNTKVPGWVR